MATCLHNKHVLSRKTTTTHGRSWGKYEWKPLKHLHCLFFIMSTTWHPPRGSTIYSYAAGVEDAGEVEFIRLVSQTGSKRWVQAFIGRFTCSQARSLQMSNVKLTCPSLPSSSLSLPACLLPLTLMLMLNWCAECVERFCYMRNAICKCVPHTHTSTHTQLHTCRTALICIDSRTLETLISWASARSQCDGCSNLCLHSHNILFIKINDFDLTYNPSHAHNTHACMPGQGRSQS